MNINVSAVQVSSLLQEYIDKYGLVCNSRSINHCLLKEFSIFYFYVDLLQRYKDDHFLLRFERKQDGKKYIFNWPYTKSKFTNLCHRLIKYRKGFCRREWVNLDEYIIKEFMDALVGERKNLWIAKKYGLI